MSFLFGQFLDFPIHYPKTKNPCFSLLDNFFFGALSPAFFFFFWHIRSPSSLFSPRTPSSTSPLLPSLKDFSCSFRSTLNQASLLRKLLTHLFPCSWCPQLHRHSCFWPSEQTCVLNPEEAFSTSSQFIFRHHCLINLSWLTVE